MAYKDIKSIKENAIRVSDENYNNFIDIGSTIWRFAEKYREEYKSAHYLIKKLEAVGYMVKRSVGGFPTSFIGEFSNGAGSTIGLLCEYDALPGLSSEVSGEYGHGCGHNLFATSAIGTAIVLKKVMENEQIKGTIKVFGTPSEENYGSKQFFAKQGLFDGVDVFFGFHPGPGNGVAFKKYNAITSKKYKFYGRPSHAGLNPESGRSALDAVEIMNVAVNFLREHVTSDVRIHYIISNGGKASNIVPAFAESDYSIRAEEMENLEGVVNRIDKIAYAAAMATECEVEIEHNSTYASTILNRSFSELANKNAYFVGTPNFTQEDQERAKELGFLDGLPTEIEPLPMEKQFSRASTDESDVSWIAPWTRIAMATVANGTVTHTVEMTKQVNYPAAYKGITQTIKVTSCTALDILMSKEILEEIKKEHIENMKGKKYCRDKNTYPEAKYFPNMPGVKILSEKKLSINLKETILLQDFSDLQINVYKGNNKIGSCIVIDNACNYEIMLTERLYNNDILILKYQMKYSNEETLLGYINVSIEDN